MNYSWIRTSSFIRRRSRVLLYRSCTIVSNYFESSTLTYRKSFCSILHQLHQVRERGQSHTSRSSCDDSQLPTLQRTALDRESLHRLARPSKEHTHHHRHLSALLLGYSSKSRLHRNAVGVHQRLILMCSDFSHHAAVIRPWGSEWRARCNPTSLS
jgi:hypothetical protein